MRFRSSHRHLAFFAEGQNIIAYDVFFAVMLMKTPVANVVDQIILKQNPSTTFVRIQSPATVAGRIDIVDHIVADGRAFRGSQRIDAAHVAENAVANVMQVIELDLVAFSPAFAISPAPPDRHGGIEKVRNIAMRNGVIRTVPNPHTNSARHNAAA